MRKKSHKNLTVRTIKTESNLNNNYDGVYNLSTEATEFNQNTSGISKKDSSRSTRLSPVKKTSSKFKIDLELQGKQMSSSSFRGSDILLNFIDSYNKSNDYLQESNKIFEKKVCGLKKSYKLKPSENDVFLENYHKELKSNLMPINEKKPLFYVKNNEFMFYDRSDQHVFKTIQSINKCDDNTIFKFRNIINDKFDMNDSSFKLKRSEEKFDHNHQKIEKLLKDTSSKRKIVLFNINHKVK